MNEKDTNRIKELQQEGFTRFAVREQAQAAIAKANTELQEIFNQIAKLEQEPKKSKIVENKEEING